MEVSDLLGLSVQTQAVLASGYAAQMVAFRGLRRDQSAADILFSTLVFGLPALAVLAIGNRWGWSLWVSIPAGLLWACLVGALWRRWVRRWFDEVLRDSGITWSSDHKSAWAWVLDSDGKKVSEVVVELKDGTYLYFSGNPDTDASLARRPIHFGADGGIAMRVSKAQYAGADDWTEIDDATNEAGDNLTYLPSIEIARVDIRYKK